MPLPGDPGLAVRAHGMGGGGEALDRLLPTTNFCVGRGEFLPLHPCAGTNVPIAPLMYLPRGTSAERTDEHKPP